ncbi:hypothetical protein KR093_004957 [Drosophila rubida]|uniref:Uncharacterized protein n=1 Tax=Drosophila rubida TaxID=30044 RepID=A0AAD4PKS0_9MUSC|nr:hypothetical protein KR093_004957 [Drosophila rubida]
MSDETVEPTIHSAEYNFAAGDAGQIPAQPTEEVAAGKPSEFSANYDAELSAGDHVEPKAASSRSSIYSTVELEERWKLRLQKLAEFENMQSERNESSAGDGDEMKADPPTWKQFWSEATQNSTDSDQPT